MHVWIDQTECTGVGVCVDACPRMFVVDSSDGLAYVETGGLRYGHNQPAPIADAVLEAVIDAAEDCPQNCIFIGD
jgi:ferredoxin